MPRKMSISDMIKFTFSKNSAIKRYNINKIKYDTSDYSLKNKLLLEDDISFNESNSISCKNYAAEDTLTRIIKINSTKYKDIDASYIKSNNPNTWGHNFGTLTDRSRNTVTGSRNPIILNNDLYINLENLIYSLLYEKYLDNADKIVSIQKEYLESEFKNILDFIDKSELLDAILQLICALTRKDSLIPNLSWLITKDFKDINLNDVNDFKHIEDCLKNKNTMYTQISKNIDCDFLPYKHPFNKPHTTIDGYDGCMFDSNFFKQDPTDCEDLIKGQFEKVILFGIEILNAISTIKNTDYQDKLHSLLLTNFDKNPKICRFIKDNLYDVDTYGNILINTKVSEIIAIKDMSKRYEAIREYLDEVNKKPYPNLYSYLNIATEYVPIFLGVFTKFSIDYSIRSIRIKIILFLLNIIKEEKISLKDSDEVDDYYVDGIDDLLSDLSSIGISPEASNELFNFNFKDYLEDNDKDVLNKDYDYSEKIAKNNASNEILDRALSEFTENSYDFKIETKSNRTINQSAKDKYDIVYSKIKLITQNLSKRIKDIKTYNEGGKNSGLSKGKLDKKNLYHYKYDKNIFYNNTYKIRESDLAFGILLDASGSMSGKAIEDGKITMIILHEVLKTLKINHCIATHTSYGYHDCRIEKYVQFKENANYDFSKCYDLVNIRAHNGNCDSGALYFMEKELLRAKNKDKICLIFSDGEPTECTGGELRDQIKHMEKLGIKVIGIGINFESIKDYYTDYANGKNLKDMLDITANILQEYVLDKKD